MLLIFGLSVITHALPATDYYLSNNGNDGNNGTSVGTPWKTLAKLSAALGGPSGTWGTISTGDRVFFRRGDVFRGSIAFAAFNNNGITFDAYDVGARPVIKGSQLVTGWTVHSGNIWKATVSQRVHFLYDGSASKTLARTPNIGTYTLTSAGTNSLSSSSVSGLPNLVGANVCVREYDWRLNRQVVTAQSGSTISWTNPINAANAGANFYLDNHLNLLDAAGEWFWSNNTLYYMSAVDPNTLTIEASVNLKGVAGNDNRSGNTFQNLRFEHYAGEAINLMGASDDNVIRDCQFQDNLQALAVSGDNANIQQNSISDCYYQGAVLANMANSTFSNNTINSIALNFGQHRPDFTGDFYSGGLWLINGLPGCTLANNTLSDIGFNGIRFGGRGITIERNHISNVLLNMDDGGAIYTYGNDSYDCVIQNNIISGVLGDKNGVSPGGIALGIYIDNYAHNMQILNNTIQDIPAGGAFLINAGAFGCTMMGNTAYRCKQGATFFDWLPGASVQNNTLSGNTFYTNLMDGIPMLLASDDNNYVMLSASNNNFLCNPYGTSVVQYLWSNPQQYTLEQWRSATNLDLASVGSYYQWTPPTDNSFIVVNHTGSPQTYSYSNVVDLNNQPVTSLTLQPFTSRVLILALALPVELVKFEGITEGGKNILMWRTIVEENVRDFDLERSNDGQVFERIGTIKSRGGGANYAFMDGSPEPASNYYRLKINDLNGDVSFSKIIVLENNGMQKGLKVYPNPANGAEITVETNQNAEVSLLIINSVGQIIFQQISMFTSDLKIDVSRWPNGTYLVKQDQQVIKFVK